MSRPADPGTELICVRSVPGVEHPSITKAHNGVVMISAPASYDARALRELGMARASGDIVAFFDRGKTPPVTWMDELRDRLRATQSGRDAGRTLPLSVVVPVHVQKGLEHVLAALTSSDLPASRWELVVVADGSDPATEAVASRYADVVVRLRRKVPYGPAYSRNRGVEVCRGRIVAFIDGDVQVHPDTLSRFVQALDSRPELAAVFGSYDDRPSAAGVVSQYRNLLETYCRQSHGGEATTFWAACGAIRTRIFVDAGMYDEWRFRRPQIEDLDLGQRIMELGHRVHLMPEIQGTHLKRWTLAGMLATDLRDRGIVWSRVVSSSGVPRNGGRGIRRQATGENALLTALATILAFEATVASQAWLLAGALTLVLGVVWNNRSQLRWFVARRGVVFTAATIPLDLARNLVHGLSVVAGTLAREVIGEPKPDVVVQAFAEVGLQVWPPIPTRRR